MLRKRKNRRYNEEEANEEEESSERKFDLSDKIKSERFEHDREKHLVELPGEAITLKLIQRNGFEKPILVSEPDGLDLRVPSKNFLVRDVRNYVGHQRIIDVMDVKTQKNIEMSMKDWCKYYESKHRDKLLNVISLEFSHTKLDELVESPMIVRLLDWVDLVWPKFLKESQTESTNTITDMKYPKVQKYCLMSVKGSYTDFHIDFGGTSVWYHILKGKKIFWMVPPTELNLQTFEEWTLSGMQQEVFFGDTVEECVRVELCAGNTFFIPSGWIHAVYTLEDSLVFGGNFLHSFGIENQLKVSKIEDATKVPIKFRYPFYTEILWYVVQHYVQCLTGKDHLHRFDTSASSTSLTEKKDVSIASKNNEIENETTESELDEQQSDTDANKGGRGKKRGSIALKKRRGRPPKSAPKRSKKDEQVKKKASKTSADEDDEATDIYSDSEDDQPTVKPVATCRMTKNSLLRLQYEIDDSRSVPSASPSKQSGASKAESSGKVPSKNSSPSEKQKLKTESPLANQSLDQQQQNQSKTSLNLADIALSNETKLNGWSTGASGQSTWSSSNVTSDSPPKIHITKYESSGLRALVKHLSKLSGAKKNMPALIRNSRALLDDCRKLIAEHENDDPELAVTGKPITLELLNRKKADINELIGQFFKPVESASSEGNSPMTASSPVKAKAELAFGTKVSKLAHLAISTSDGSTSKEDRKSSVSSEGQSPSGESGCESKSKLIKETKCLSPSKRPSNATAAPTSSSPSPRPKSPPTRPLSNNQYTSKTRSSGGSGSGISNISNNNMLLPGSFADLIAATSTEKKVFEVDANDVTSSLFGSYKDLSHKSSSSSSSHPKTSSKADRISSNFSSYPSTVSAHVKLSTHASSHSAAPVHKSQFDIASMAGDSAICSGSSSDKEPARLAPTTPHTHRPNSPEPPKTPMPKRFINPTYKPQNKEKLIFASAPYISPVHADQSRTTGPYPWQGPPLASTPMHPHSLPQTPTHSSQHQSTPITTAPASYSPETPRPSLHSTPVAPRELDQQHHQRHSAPSPPFLAQESQLAIGKTRLEAPRQLPSSLPAVSPTLLPAKVEPSAFMMNPNEERTKQSGNRDHSQVNVIMKPEQFRKSAPSLQESVKKSVQTSITDAPQQRSHLPNKQPGFRSPALPSPGVIVEPNRSMPNKDTLQPSTSTTHEQANESTDKSPASAKKPAKPRGPPKKSKEAREAIESELRTMPLPSLAPAPIALVQGGRQPMSHLGTTTTTLPVSAVQPLPAESAQSTKTTKGKRSKKVPKEEQQKQQHKPPQASAPANMPPTLNPLGPQVMVTHAGGQPMFCSLVTQPPMSAMASAAGTSAPKVSPPSYLFSRPLLFNPLAGLSAAQFAQMPRTSALPLLSAPMAAPLGLPFQQGARIVWTTPPRQMQVATVNTSTGGRTMAVLGGVGTTTKVSAPITSKGAQTITSSAASARAAANDNAALLSLATTALSTAPMVSSPALSQLGARAGFGGPQALMVSSAGTHPAAALFAATSQAGQLRPCVPTQLPRMAHLVSQPSTRPAGGQLVFARLPNQTAVTHGQAGPRYLITQPGFMQQRFGQAQQLVGSQGAPNALAFATFRPPSVADPSKAMKTKKVKTS